MKNLWILLSLLVVSTASVNVWAEPANLKIRLQGYDPTVHKQFVAFIFPDVTFSSKQQFKLSPTGEVDFSIDLNEPRELTFEYDNRRIPLLTAPGDELILSLPLAQLRNYRGAMLVEVSGTYATSNRLLLRYFRTIEGWISGATSAFAADKSLPEVDYRSLREQQMRAHLSRLDSLAQADQLTDELALHFMRTQIRYAAGLDYCLFPFMARINRGIAETDPYFDFVPDFAPQDDWAPRFSAYITYVQYLGNSLNTMCNIADQHKAEREQYLLLDSSVFPLKFRVVDRLKVVDQRKPVMQYVLLYAFRGGQHIPERYYDSLARYVSPEEIAAIRVRAQGNASPQPVVDLLRDFDLDADEKQPLLDLYEGTEGKVVFHDFWFRSCPPCMAELPHYNALIEAAGEEVVFIFMGAAFMEEATWRKTIEELGLQGRQHHLTADQMAFYERHFGLRGFPMHQVLDPQGVMVDTLLPQIKSENVPAIVNRLRAVAQGEE